MVGISVSGLTVKSQEVNMCFTEKVAKIICELW